MRAFLLLLFLVLGTSCGGSKANVPVHPCVGFAGAVFPGCNLKMTVATESEFSKQATKLTALFVSAKHSVSIEFTEKHRRPPRVDDCSEMSEAIERLMWEMLGPRASCD